jgi:uncharacterized protein (TIGR02284 family)
MQNNDAIDTLNHLIAIAKDGVNGMRSAAENAKDPSLRSTLERLGRERDRIASDLQSTVQSLGGSPDDSGTMLGTTHRWFMNAKDAITGFDDRRLLEECERGEDYAVKEFREALGQELPGGIAQRVQSWFTQVQSSHDEIKHLRDAVA